MGSTDGEKIRRALRALNSGLLVVMPTDTVYGVGARDDDAAAVARLFSAKGRGGHKPLPILVSSLEVAEKIGQLTPAARRLAQAFWPGPLTIVTGVQDSFSSEALAGERTVGLRMPDNQLALALIAGAGGSLAVSSANQSGAPETLTVDEARLQLGDSVAVYLDGGRAAGAHSSTVVDATSERVRILRPGPVTEEQILATLDG